MREQIKAVDGETLLPLSSNALAAMGLHPGDQVEVTVVGQSLVVQLPKDDVPIDSEFIQTFQGVMEKRRDAYQEMAYEVRTMCDEVSNAS